MEDLNLLNIKIAEDCRDISRQISTTQHHSLVPVITEIACHRREHFSSVYSGMKISEQCLARSLPYMTVYNHYTCVSAVVNDKY